MAKQRDPLRLSELFLVVVFYVGLIIVFAYCSQSHGLTLGP